MENQYIKAIRLIDKAGEYTGSYVKLMPLPNAAGESKAVFSHITFGSYPSAPLKIDHNITSSFTLGDGTGSFAMEGPIYAFHMTAGSVLASYTDQYEDGPVD
tara:strand:- start:170 stop:475 length:306 start_codon:yes stop_codon:yes gene_type:complete